ncbi:MAG: STAS domain-containing protein [Vicinamibacterales bacterium]
MTLNERRIGDVTVLDMKGRLVLEDGDAVLRTRVNELLEQGRSKVVLNLKDVTYIDSCGVGVLIAKLVSMRNKGGDLRLINLTERSRRLLEISQLLNVFAIYQDEPQAIDSFMDQTSA